MFGAFLKFVNTARKCGIMMWVTRKSHQTTWSPLTILALPHHTVVMLRIEANSVFGPYKFQSCATQSATHPPPLE